MPRTMPPTPDTLQSQRYARHLALPEIGPAGQARLRAASVAVVGAGGLGSPVALYLAAAGVGRIGLIDFDRVELSNLQRQVLFAEADVGRPKAEAARERLLALDASLDVVAHAERLTAASARRLLGGYDVVVDGSDRLPVRYLVNDACVLLGKPLVAAAIHRFEGQAMTYAPGKAPCYRCLFPDSAEAIVPNCEQAGVLGVLPGVMGSLQATEVVKVLLGIGTPLYGRLLVYDALALTFQELRFARRADCIACGDNPRITLETATEGTDMIENWTPGELRARLDAPDGAKLYLVDVRETHEWEGGRIPGSVHIPLGSLPQRLGEIPADRTAVFICAVGGRSMVACRYAAQNGLEAVNLDGGVIAWGAEFGPLPLP